MLQRPGPGAASERAEANWGAAAVHHLMLVSFCSHEALRPPRLEQNRKFTAETFGDYGPKCIFALQNVCFLPQMFSQQGSI